MATSWVQVCNLALNMLGANSITSLTQDSKEARACSRWYEQARDEVLESHPWKCATYRQSLAQLTDVPITDDYDYYYQLPTNPYCLKVRDAPNVPAAVYKIEGRRLLTNETSIIIRYTKRITDPTEMDALLTTAIAAKIAEVISYDITHSGAVTQAMRAVYQDSLMMAIDGDITGDENPQPDNTNWITAGRS